MKSGNITKDDFENKNYDRSLSFKWKWHINKWIVDKSGLEFFKKSSDKNSQDVKFMQNCSQKLQIIKIFL